MQSSTPANHQAPPLTPTQQSALEELLALAKVRAMPLVELRSPPALGRGHGVTSVLRACATSLGVPLFGVSTMLDWATTGSDGSSAARTMHAVAKKSLEEHGIALIDDADLAVAPRSIRRSRTLVGSLKGAGDIHNWDVAPAPAMLLKTLGDAAAACGGMVIFSALEDAHLALMQGPLTVKLGEPREADYVAVLQSRLGMEAVARIDAGALYSLHSQLSPGDLSALAARACTTPLSRGVAAAEAIPDTEVLLAQIRGELAGTTAVSPEDVEAVDLTNYPGLQGIKEELEKNVLFPLENPELAAKLGLTPKRGVLVHGKPGTGKTTVGRWLAHRLKGKFFLVGEMMLQADIIKVFAAARAAAPAVVFIDDADIVIGGWRPLDGHRGSDVFRFLLSNMDGITSRGERSREQGDVIIMLTAQSVHWMAEMLLRSGRIELWLKTKLPEPKQKREILQKYIQEDPGALELLGVDGRPPDVRAAAQISDHFCCADLRRIVSDAKMLAAWDRQKGGGAKEVGRGNKDYLERAAESVRQMQQEVYENTRHLYG
jgi:transitional endoplasmic reticulum ATPase